MRRTTRRFLAAFITSLTVAAVCALTSPATPAGAATGPSCGATVFKSPGVPWVCTFDDEFTSAKIDTSKWSVVTTADSGYHSGTECFTASGVSQANGYLALTARNTVKSFACAKPVGIYYTHYTGGSVTSAAHFSQTYGLYSVRALFPAAVVGGLQTSLWLYPKNPSKYGNWPRSGEIDLAENYSSHADLAIPYVHYIPKGVDKAVTNDDCHITVGAFHTYTALWTPTAITITIDGTVCVKDAPHPAGGLVSPQPFDSPFVVNLTQALGVTRNGPSQHTPLPATTYVDYVRVWK